MGSASTTAIANYGRTIYTSTNATGGPSTNSVYYSAPQNTGVTGNSTVVTNIAQSGRSLNTSGTFQSDQWGYSSAPYFSANSYYSAAGSGGGNSSSLTASFTSGVDTYQQSNSGSYSGETNGTFVGSLASGAFQSTQNSPETSVILD